MKFDHLLHTQEAHQQGLPEPQILEIGMRVRMTIYLAETIEIKRIKYLGNQEAMGYLNQIMRE